MKTLEQQNKNGEMLPGEKLSKKEGEIVIARQYKEMSGGSQGFNQPNPFLLEKVIEPYCIYDGNKALERERAIEGADLDTLNILSHLRKRDPLKYSSENIAKILNYLESWKSKYDLDIRYVSGRIKKTRLNLFPPSIKEKIFNDIISGKLAGYNERYLTKYIKGGKDGLEVIKNKTKTEKENRLVAEREKQLILSKLREEEQGEQEFFASEYPVAAIETHAGKRSLGGDYQYIKENLPPQVDCKFLRINYQEGVSAKKDEYIEKEPGDFQEITDHSGRIDDSYLDKLVKKDESAHFLFTGGNLRGCLSSSIKAVADAIEKNNPEKTDIHILLDKTYDNSAYDTLGKFPTDSLKSRLKLFVKIYKDGDIIDASSHKISDGQVNVNVFLWSRSEYYFQKFKSALELEKIREDIKNSDNN